MISDCLFKRNDIYYFRLRIPQDIEPYFSCNEIWKSLRTKNYQSAKTTISKLLYITERLFLHVRSGMFTSDQVKKLVTDYLHNTLERKERHREIAPLSYTFEGRAICLDTWIPGGVDACNETIKILQRKLALNQYEDMETKIKKVLEGTDTKADVGSSDYNKLCRELLKAEIGIFTIERERIQGNYDNDYDDYMIRAVAPAPVQASPALPTVPGVLLSKVVEEHVKEAVLADSWTEKTLAENTSIYRVMMEIIGDQDIKAIDNQMLLDFRNTLAKLPPNRDKVPRYKGKTIKQILAMRNVEPMSKTTVNKYIIRIGSLFKWAAKKKFIIVNYAEGLSLSTRSNAYEERETYSKDDIQRLFSHLKHDPKEPQEYWIPLIALYEGMRLEEICQLHMADIIEMDTLPCISINDDGDKRIKTNAGKRIIPIHPELIKLGFMDYISELRKSNAIRVWPRLTKGRDGYSHVYGKKYQRFNRSFITKNPKRVFHSFRHTLANTLKQAGVQEIVIAEILGHANESETSGRYGKKYEPKVLLEALLKLDYGSPVQSEPTESEVA